jgi:hypothetical protein
MDLRLTPGEHVLRRDVPNRAVQANIVVMLDVAFHQTPRIVQRQSRLAEIDSGRTNPNVYGLVPSVPSVPSVPTENNQCAATSPQLKVV